MRVVWIMIAGGLLLGAAEGRAQQISVRVVHAREGTPLAGALVSLRSMDGVVRVRALTGSEGRITFRAPVPGRYVPHADAIGYRGVDGQPVDLDGEVPTVEFALEPAPFALEELVVGANRSVVCNMRAESAQLTSRVWEEARKALFGTVLTRTQDPPRMEIELFQRRLTPSGWIAWEQTARGTVLSDRPFTTADPAELHQHGWVRPDVAGTVYYGPDAEMLLSDTFLEDHCFRAVATDDQRLGLEFSPNRNRKVPEIAGTLWLDPKSMELRSLEFRFVNLEIPDRILRDARLGGRLTFDRLATGGWYIRDWNILTPFLQRRVRVNRTDYVIAWYQDVGGTARPEGGSPPAVVVTGQVLDSLTGRPLAGAAISFGGTTVVVSDSTGAFRAELMREGDYVVTVSHPELTVVGLEPMRDSVRVRAPGVRLDLTSPSAEAQLALLCPRDVRRPGLGALSAVGFEGAAEQDIHVQVEVPRSAARPQKALGFEGGNTVTSRVLHREDVTAVQVTTRPGRPFYICGIDRNVPLQVIDSVPGLPLRVRDVGPGRARVHPMLLDRP